MTSHKINEKLPNYFVNSLKKINISGKKVVFLGQLLRVILMTRSLSIKLKEILEKNGAKVFCNVHM